MTHRFVITLFYFMILSFLKPEIFTKDIQEDIEKVLKNQQANAQAAETKFEINLTHMSPWKAFEGLQEQLHVVSLKPEAIQTANVITMIENLTECCQSQGLPSTMYRICGSMLLQLIMLMSK